MQKRFRQYHLTRELAQKHSHSTYLASATDEPEHQMVLIVFASSLFRFPHERENLLRKAICIKGLQHPHVAPILDMGIEQEQPFVVREYWPNGSLRSRLKKLSPGHMELGEALTIVSQVGQALVYAHERNIVHGTIKPENILLNADGQALLTDFSLFGRKDAIMRDQTSQEYAFCYLAPEQFAGTCDARSDQYALGCLAYELITGRVPFAAQSLPSMMRHQSNKLPAPLSQSVADLPASLEVTILKTLARDPAQRFFDFSLFLEVIQSVLSPPPVFPLLRSSYFGKKRAISHPVPSAKAETIPSSICKHTTKRVAPQLPEPSAALSSAEAEMAEPASAHPLVDVSMPKQTGTISVTALLASSVQSQLFISSLSLDPDPLRNAENASLSHLLQGHKYHESSDPLVELVPLSEVLTAEPTIATPISEQEPDKAWFTDPFMEEKGDRLPMRAVASSADVQSEDTTGKMVSSLARSIHRREPMPLLAMHSRRRVLKWGLLLSVIMAITCSALWFSGIQPFDIGSFLTDSANLSTVPTRPLIQTPKIHPLVLSTAIPTATASFSQNGAIANSTPHAENASSTSNATYQNSNTHTTPANPSLTPTATPANPSPTPTATPANSDSHPSRGGWGWGWMSH